MLTGRSAQEASAKVCAREPEHNEQQSKILSDMCDVCQGAGVVKEAACWATRQG